MKLSEPLQVLKGIGDKTAEAFACAGITTIGELLHYFPRRYDAMPEISTIKDLESGRKAVVRVRILRPPSFYSARGKRILSFTVGDGTGELKISYFNAAYMRNKFSVGMQVLLYGHVSDVRGGLGMGQPRILEEKLYEQARGHLLPVYPITKKLTEGRIRSAVENAMPALESVREYLPAPVLADESLLSVPEAIRLMHSPRSMEEVYAARKRLAFDEFLLFLYRMERLKEGEEKEKNDFPVSAGHQETVEVLLKAQPYECTKPQRRAIDDILGDMSGPYAMNRLVQGDVGCGKTLVAFAAAQYAISGGAQALIMAPTEVLASQHYANALDMAEKGAAAFRPVLLTGSLSAAGKRKAKEQIRRGEVNLIIGTHAVLEEDVEFAALALAVTDEQHRFGVRQRGILSGKNKDGKRPHILVMSATPIPRTLGLILYGDLDVSLIDELPANRIPIKNTVLDPSYRIKLWQFILKRVSEGRQAYIICPMVEEGEDGAEGLQNVTDYSREMAAKMPPGIVVDMLHGRMKPKEKNEVMERFARGEIHILVSTTVVEVGVNVPNASVMMVENAERFGLAQLHQLRGRVGRGQWQSYCIFVAGGEKGLSKHTRERLAVLEKTNDGFQIAEEDLKQRGPGDFFGLKQSGLPYFKIADIYTDAELLKRTSQTLSRMREADDDTWHFLKEHIREQDEMDYITFHGICL